MLTNQGPVNQSSLRLGFDQSRYRDRLAKTSHRFRLHVALDHEPNRFEPQEQAERNRVTAQFVVIEKATKKLLPNPRFGSEPFSLHLDPSTATLVAQPDLLTEASERLAEPAIGLR